MGRKVMLVEGKDDEHVLKSIFGYAGLDHITFKENGGIDPLLESLPLRLKESDVEALGVMVDADVNATDRWNSIKAHLSEAGYEAIPIVPDPNGTILLPPEATLLPRVGVWIMPDNHTTGNLEDFLHFLVPESSLLFDHVNLSLDQIPEAECRFNSANKSKARIHTWLAWQEEPGKPLGLAITAKFLDPSVKQVDVLVDWLKSLYFHD